jgi:hypothetical protein
MGKQDELLETLPLTTRKLNDIQMLEGGARCPHSKNSLSKSS